MAKGLIDSADLIAKLPVVEEDKQISLIGAVADVVTMISECKPVDAVEVCYCKDCSKWMSEFGGCKEFTTERLPTGGKKVFITKPDDFCSYGERKEV